MSVRSDTARNDARNSGTKPHGRGAHMISRAAIRDIDEEITHEYLLSLSAIHESSLLAYQHVEGGLRVCCPSLDDLDTLDQDGEIPTPTHLPSRRYAERI